MWLVFHLMFEIVLHHPSVCEYSDHMGGLGLYMERQMNDFIYNDILAMAECCRGRNSVVLVRWRRLHGALLLYQTIYKRSYCLNCV